MNFNRLMLCLCFCNSFILYDLILLQAFIIRKKKMNNSYYIKIHHSIRIKQPYLDSHFITVVTFPWVKNFSCRISHYAAGHTDQIFKSFFTSLQKKETGKQHPFWEVEKQLPGSDSDQEAPDQLLVDIGRKRMAFCPGPVLEPSLNWPFRFSATYQSWYFLDL